MPICKVCDSENTRKETVIDGRQRYQCLDCKNLFFDDDKPKITAVPPKYACKKCAFTTDSRFELASHRSSAHHWKKKVKSETVPSVQTHQAMVPVGRPPKAPEESVDRTTTWRRQQKKANRADNLSDDQRIDILWCLMKNYQTTPDLAKKILDLVRILDGF